MQTRLRINQLKNEIIRIKATFKANPVTDFNDARVARINKLNKEIQELSKLLPREKLVGKKASDKRSYSKHYDGRRRMGANDEKLNDDPDCNARRTVRMGAEMQTRLRINQLKNEIVRIKATFKANPVTDFKDARVARINKLNK